MPFSLIIRKNMAPRIAVAKIHEVARQIQAVTPVGTSLGNSNAQLIFQALAMARSGQSIAAFLQLSAARVPAGTVRACCMLYSARSGCSSHGYPRTN